MDLLNGIFGSLLGAIQALATALTVFGLVIMSLSVVRFKKRLD